MENARRKKLQDELRDERQAQKEREREGAEFSDKDVFVTSAYVPTTPTIIRLTLTPTTCLTLSPATILPPSLASPLDPLSPPSPPPSTSTSPSPLAHPWAPQPRVCSHARTHTRAHTHTHTHTPCSLTHLSYSPTCAPTTQIQAKTC
jgi:hypothetical protein